MSIWGKLRGNFVGDPKPAENSNGNGNDLPHYYYSRVLSNVTLLGNTTVCIKTGKDSIMKLVLFNSLLY